MHHLPLARTFDPLLNAGLWLRLYNINLGSHQAALSTKCDGQNASTSYTWLKLVRQGSGKAIKFKKTSRLSGVSSFEGVASQWSAIFPFCSIGARYLAFAISVLTKATPIIILMLILMLMLPFLIICKHQLQVQNAMCEHLTPPD